MTATPLASAEWGGGCRRHVGVTPWAAMHAARRPAILVDARSATHAGGRRD